MTERYRPLLVTAHLSSPLAGDAPRLDAVLEFAACRFHKTGIPDYKITRDGPPPPMGDIPIGMHRDFLGEWLVACCSDAILPELPLEAVEHVTKKISVEAADLLAPKERHVVSTSNSWTKSYRIPLRIRPVNQVRWFVLGHRRSMLRYLGHIEAIGKKVSVGYGRIRSWEIDETDKDYWWFAPAPTGTLLMATLPQGQWLPADLVGARPDFRSCTPPYWSLARLTEAVVPC